jgi:beta-lactamase class A
MTQSRRERIQQHLLSRRELLLGAVTIIPVIRSRSFNDAIVHRFSYLDDDFAAIERRVRGRLGVAALDTGSGSRLEHRQDERFAMCSTFKVLAAAAILKRVDDNKDELSRRVRYSEKDLLDYAPITRQHVGEGSMTLSALCAAAIEYSDNTAANLLLEVLGGPAGITSYARSIGDSVTRLDRTEPTLNTALPGDARDTTSPGAMLNDLQTILLGSALSAASRQQIADWLVANTTGNERLRKAVPATWQVGDKTGSGQRGAYGDVAIMWPPKRAPILVAAYLVETDAPTPERDAALRDVGRVVVEKFR